LRQVEIAQIGAEHRDSKGNLLPLSPDADLRLVTLAAQRIIERAWGSRAITTRAKTSKPPRAFARRITTEALEQLQLILERGKERAAGRDASARGEDVQPIEAEVIAPPTQHIVAATFGF